MTLPETAKFFVAISISDKLTSGQKMYVSKLNRQEDLEEVRNFLKTNGFGILVNQTDGRLWATHIPLVVEKNAAGQDVLSSHVSIANPQWKDFADDREVLAIFQGPHAYVSSSWYDHENVPTWNYIAVHVYGKTRILRGDETLEALKKMVNKYEAASKNPVTVEGMSEKFLESHVRGIVCFEIVVSEIHAAYKLSQNRDDKNYSKIMEELNLRGDAESLAVAAEMARRRNLTI